MPSSPLLQLTIATLVFGLSGCGSGDNSVLVALSNLPPRATQLSVHATLNQMTLMDGVMGAPLALPLTQLGIIVPAPGHLVLDMQALDSDQCTQGSAKPELDVIAGLNNLSVPFAAQSPRKCGNLAPCASGASCPIASSGTTSSIHSIWTIAPNDIWAVGVGAAVLHYDGNGWTVTPTASLPIPATTTLNGVWASASNDVWAVGSAGSIIHYDGTKWSLSPSSAQRTLSGISGVSAQSIWTVGFASSANPAGEFLHWNGTSWTAIAPLGNGDLWAVLAVSANFVLIGGDKSGSGVLWSFDGTSKFTSYSAAAPVPVYALWAASPKRAVAVGALGEILIFDGTSWTLTGNMISNDFAGITSDGSTTYIVGGNGVGYRSTDPKLATLVPITNLPKISYLWSVQLASNGLSWLTGDNGYVGYLDTRP